jgi:hypothetical protein
MGCLPWSAEGILLNLICGDQEHGLIDAFDEIVTNRAEWDENGRLNIRPRLDPEDPYRHVCQIGCEPNMCKGGLMPQ